MNQFKESHFKMKYHHQIIGLICVFIIGTPLFAAPKGKATLGVHTVTITPSIKEAILAKGKDKVLSLRRVAESLEQQLIDRVHNTRKFSIVARADLERLLKDQELQSFSSDPSDANVAQAFKIAGCQYALFTMIDDFQDLEQVLKGEGGVVLATKRSVRLSVVAKIYDVTTGVLLETANFQTSNKDGKQHMTGSIADGKTNDQMLTAMARIQAFNVANRVMDVIYPAKIIGMTGDQITINRGDGTGIAKGQTWSVFALGEELIDPDTGEKLGAEEVAVGKAQIISVTPKFSRARVTENLGVSKLQVLRMDVPAY